MKVKKAVSFIYGFRSSGLSWVLSFFILQIWYLVSILQVMRLNMRTKENLKIFCAPGTSIRDEMIEISESVQLRLITFHPKEKTENPPVLFVAGWVSRIEAWQNVLLEMTKEFIVYYIETREKISSRLSQKTRFDVDLIGDDIVKCVDILNLKKDNYLLFGSSLGATVILDCYSRLSVDPCCLVLIGPNAEFRMPLIWKIIIILFYPPFYSFLKPFIKWHLKYFRLNIKTDLAQYQKYCRALDGADPAKLKPAALSFSTYQIWDKLPGVNVPVLIFGGSHDKLHEPENLRRMISMLPNAHYVDMETNARTHSKEVVVLLKKFVFQCKNVL